MARMAEKGSIEKLILELDTHLERALIFILYSCWSSALDVQHLADFIELLCFVVNK